MSGLAYNERAWAIDLISAINLYTTKKKLKIVRAGGENTLKGKKAQSLFPDVLLYGDDTGIRVRHGWELKFPDTPINDKELIENAIEKANRLRVNSFLVWNVDEAALYAREDAEGNDFKLIHAWDALGIKKRGDVAPRKDEWEARLVQILDDLNGFFDKGVLKSAMPADILDDGFIADFLAEYSGVATDAIRSACGKSATKDAEAKMWWNLNAVERGKKPTDPLDFSSVAHVALVSWINRFLFSHYLKNFNGKAALVDGIIPDKSVTDANAIFDEITNACDFLQVFRNEIGANDIGEEAWEGLCQLNGFLIDLKLEEVPQDALHAVIETVLKSARRKAAGQYTTPVPLARLLVGLAIEDREDTVIDPCCGTGTIARAAYDLKRSSGQTASNALATVWASDMFQFPLQLCTIALADPEAMGEVVQIFKHDVFELASSQKVSFIDPNSGKEEIRIIPKFGSAVSNLPFVRGEQLAAVNAKAKSALEKIEKDEGISGRSDLLGYILIYLKTLVKENGRIGVIVSNSWLGTDWGRELREKMEASFHIVMVATSAAGKWFDNADVVTNIIVLETRKPEANDVTKFITTKKPISEWDGAYIDDVVATALASKKSVTSANLQISLHTRKAIKTIEGMCGSWSPLFPEVSWLPLIAPNLKKLSAFFDIARGERRGWNDMFYPADGHGIEGEYIRPVLRTMRDVEGYIAEPDAIAFCCSKTIAELNAAGHTGAVAWINRFVNANNETGKPLVETLARANHHWYEMKAETQADFVLGMNPEDRIFVARMRERGFVDQRLIRLSAKPAAIDLDLAHALLNTSLGLFLIEAAGFGRGLGALDLSATKIKNNLLIFDPTAIGATEKAEIIKAFAPVAGRKVLPIADEMAAKDRAALDEAVLSALGQDAMADAIRQSLLDMYRIRKSVKDAAK